MSAWRISDTSGIEFGCWDEETTQKTATLKTLEIVGVSSAGSPNSLDPIFELSDGRFLEIFSTTTLEPWVMHLPDTAYVGGT